MSKKKPLEAKIVKHAHRRRFQDYVRKKGRDKATIGYVYWNMFLRSGKGNVFELEEGLFLADLGIGKNALRPARKTLLDDGWLSKESQKVDALTGKWGTTAWTVNTEAVAHSEGVGTVAPLTGDRSADFGSAGDRSVGDTVVLHSLYANASTSTCTPLASTATAAFSVLQSFSRGADAPMAEDREVADTDKTLQSSNPEFVSEEEKQRQEQINALVEKIGRHDDIPMVLGLAYFHEGHRADLTRIAKVMHARNRSDIWLGQLVHWAKGISDAKDREGQFWKRKLQTGDKAVAKLADFLETGTIAEQFDVRLHSKSQHCLFPTPGMERDLLLRDARHLEKVRAAAVFEYAPPEPEGYTLTTLGKGFDVEEA